MQSSLALGVPPPLDSLMAEAPIALFLDFDGTLVELAESPDAIAPLLDMSDRLAALSKRMGGRLAVVSGRSIADIEKHVGPLSVAAAGSHGSDIRGGDGQSLGASAAEFPREIEQDLRAFAKSEGINYEQKPHGGALHYRSNPELGPKTLSFAKDLADKHGWAVQSGKCVAELVAKGVNKGDAVLAFMKTAPFKGARPVFIGDDITDEAGFRICRDLGGAAVAVGNRETTSANFNLPNVAAVHEWLEL